MAECFVRLAVFLTLQKHLPERVLSNDVLQLLSGPGNSIKSLSNCFGDCLHSATSVSVHCVYFIQPQVYLSILCTSFSHKCICPFCVLHSATSVSSRAWRSAVAAPSVITSLTDQTRSTPTLHVSHHIRHYLLTLT